MGSDITVRLRAAGCVFAEDEAALLISAANTPQELDAAIEQRVAGSPLEHVLGWAEFRGLRIVMTPGVFVPRRRTEFLVEQAVAHLREDAVVLDLCCGSGALGAALAAGRPGVELHAADIDPVAVRCAERNVAHLGGRVHLGDLYDPLPPSLRGRVDILLANVPYVPTREIDLLPPEARIHEPLVALDGGPEGLDLVRRVATGAGRWLTPGGRLFIETSERQAEAAAEIFEQTRLIPRILRSTEQDATVVMGKDSGG